jgi:hypothetical protein
VEGTALGFGPVIVHEVEDEGAAGKVVAEGLMPAPDRPVHVRQRHIHRLPRQPGVLLDGRHKRQGDHLGVGVDTLATAGDAHGAGVGVRPLDGQLAQLGERAEQTRVLGRNRMAGHGGGQGHDDRQQAGSIDNGHPAQQRCSHDGER